MLKIRILFIGVFLFLNMFFILTTFNPSGWLYSLCIFIFTLPLIINCRWAYTIDKLRSLFSTIREQSDYLDSEIKNIWNRDLNIVRTRLILIRANNKEIHELTDAINTIDAYLSRNNKCFLSVTRGHIVITGWLLFFIFNVFLVLYGASGLLEGVIYIPKRYGNDGSYYSGFLGYGISIVIILAGFSFNTYFIEKSNKASDKLKKLATKINTLFLYFCWFVIVFLTLKIFNEHLFTYLNF